MTAGHGRADYLFYVDQRAVGVIEAKPEGTPLSGVGWQSAMYAKGLPAEVRLKALTREGRLPFVFEASGWGSHRLPSRVSARSSRSPNHISDQVPSKTRLDTKGLRWTLLKSPRNRYRSSYPVKRATSWTSRRLKLPQRR